MSHPYLTASIDDALFNENGPGKPSDGPVSDVGLQALVRSWDWPEPVQAASEATDASYSALSVEHEMMEQGYDVRSARRVALAMLGSPDTCPCCHRSFDQ